MIEAGQADPVIARVDALEAIFEARIGPLRERLLDTPRAWGEDERDLAARMHDEHRSLARSVIDVAVGLAGTLGHYDERTRHATARALYHLGEGVKHGVFSGMPAALDYALLHRLMREAMRAGHHREKRRIPVEGRLTPCTVEFLYFRALLLARFSSGALNARQIDILDAWMWLWMPALTSVTSAPAGSALRADLDSSEGLRRGPRQDGASALYLPQAPIEEAYRSVLASFHDGHVVPEEGRASRFHLEEHVAVLDLVRRGLKESLRAEVGRAERRPVGRAVEIHFGIDEVRGCALPAREDEEPAGSAGHERRHATLLNESDTGFALRGSQEQLGATAAGDLVAMRTRPGADLELGKVVRSLASADGTVVVGVRRIGCAARGVAGIRHQPGHKPEDVMLVFIPGDDASGRRDAFLVDARCFAGGGEFHVVADGVAFSFRFNRAREEGRGWVLAGFEVTGAQTSTHSA